MLESLKGRNFPQSMLKQLMVVALFLPVFTSDYESIYAPDLIAVNVFTLLFIVGALVQKRVPLKEKNWLGWGMLALLAGYNVLAFYANWVQLDWYISQVNMTAPFLMITLLLFMEKDRLNEDDELIRFFLEAILVSNALALIVYLMGNTGVWLMNGKISILPVDPQMYERRFGWVFAHKSQYAFMLVMFLALMVTYRHLFRKKWTFLAGMVLLGACLLATNTATSMAASVLIFLGWFVDWQLEKHGGLKGKHVLMLLGIVAVLAVGFVFLLQGRRMRALMTLNGRLMIWPEGLRVIRENPYGIGQMCGIATYPVEGIPGGTYVVNNFHNLFLNLMLQFSPKAAYAIIAMMGLLAVAGLKRNLSFTTLGILGALFVPMMMDWCMLLTDYPLFLLGIYFLFFCPRRKTKDLN